MSTPVRIFITSPARVVDPQRVALELLQSRLVEAHCRGEHGWGNMRRECPLCR